MRTLSVVALGAVLALAGVAPAAAQEQRPPDETKVRAAEPSPAPEDEFVEEEEEAAPLTHIKVLEDPHEISSFYRSSQGASGPLALTMPTGAPSGPYAIAGFYRAGRAPSGYAAFWANGYGPSVRGRGGRGLVLPRRRVGENGDLCLFAPTFLAPVGPLMGAFWGN